MDFIYTYKRWLMLSTSVHLTILLFILFVNKASFMRPVLMMSTDGIGSSINVDVVGLPNVLKKDIAQLNETTEENKGSEEMVFNEGKKRETDKRSLIQTLKRSIDDKSSYLKKIDVIKGLKKAQASQGQGTGDGTGSGGIQGQGQSRTDPYFSSIKELIRSYWQVPTWMNAEGLHAQITIKIGANGELTELELTRSSGNSDFDRLAVQAVQSSAPFTPPPFTVKDLVQNGIVLSFP